MKCKECSSIKLFRWFYTEKAKVFIFSSNLLILWDKDSIYVYILKIKVKNVKNEPLPYFLSQQDQKMQNKWLGKGKPIHFKISGHFLNSDSTYCTRINLIGWLVPFLLTEMDFTRKLKRIFWDQTSLVHISWICTVCAL